MIPFIVEYVMLSSIPTRGESMSRPEETVAVNNGIILLLRTTCECLNLGKKVKSQPC